MTRYRTFGVEIETFHPTNPAYVSNTNIDRAFRAISLPVAPNAAYTGRDYAVWQIKPDASVAPHGHSLEVVSPILPGTEESLATVTTVAKWLSTNGFDVNRTCGLHFHINVADLTPYEAACVAWRYDILFDDFSAVLPASRRVNRYCPRLTEAGRNKLRSVIVEKSNVTTWGHDERFTALNLEHVRPNSPASRLEFRQHSGTLNAAKIVGWYTLLCDFIEETVRIVREFGRRPLPVAPAVVAYAYAPVAAQPLVRRQRTVRSDAQTRSYVTQVVESGGSVPYILPGSDYDVFLNILCQNGIIRQSDVLALGWAESRLRVTAHWLRRNGACLRTITRPHGVELGYVPGRDVNRSDWPADARGNIVPSRSAIFINPVQIRTRIPTSYHVNAPAPAPVRSQTDLLHALSGAPLLAGVSAETRAWYRDRVSDFA